MIRRIGRLCSGRPGGTAVEPWDGKPGGSRVGVAPGVWHERNEWPKNRPSDWLRQGHYCAVARRVGGQVGHLERWSGERCLGRSLGMCTFSRRTTRESGAEGWATEGGVAILYERNTIAGSVTAGHQVSEGRWDGRWRDNLSLSLSVE